MSHHQFSYPPFILQKEEVEELAGLDEEAELPLEQLLARYGNYHLAAQQGGGSGDEEMPGGRGGWIMAPARLSTVAVCC